MDIIIQKGCGLDVHKETVVACIMGARVRKEIMTYTTMTHDLLRLKGWLQESWSGSFYKTGKKNTHRRVQK